MRKEGVAYYAGTNEIHRYGHKAVEKVSMALTANDKGYYSIPADGGKYWTIGTSEWDKTKEELMEQVEEIEERQSKEEKMMKAYELKIAYKSGEVDEMYTRLTGKGWETEAATPEEALQEMKENDPETFEQIEANSDAIERYWAEEIED